MSNKAKAADVTYEKVFLPKEIEALKSRREIVDSALKDYSRAETRSDQFQEKIVALTDELSESETKLDGLNDKAVADFTRRRFQLDLLQRQSQPLEKEILKKHIALREAVLPVRELLGSVLQQEFEALLAETIKTLVPLFGDRAQQLANESIPVQKLRQFRMAPWITAEDPVGSAERALDVLDQLVAGGRR